MKCRNSPEKIFFLLRIFHFVDFWITLKPEYQVPAESFFNAILLLVLIRNPDLDSD